MLTKENIDFLITGVSHLPVVSLKNITEQIIILFFLGEIYEYKYLNFTKMIKACFGINEVL